MWLHCSKRGENHLLKHIWQRQNKFWKPNKSILYPPKSQRRRNLVLFKADENFYFQKYFPISKQGKPNVHFLSSPSVPELILTADTLQHKWGHLRNNWFMKNPVNSDSNGKNSTSTLTKDLHKNKTSHYMNPVHQTKLHRCIKKRATTYKL